MRQCVCPKQGGASICYCVIFQVLETYSYEDIGEVSTVKNSGLQLAMHTGGRVVVTTNKAGKNTSFDTFVARNGSILQHTGGRVVLTTNKADKNTLQQD